MRDGRPVVVREYRSWRAYLIGRIGNYCAFCNMPLTDSIQVEHVVAQDLDRSQALDWDNMLLACGACNRSKSNKPCPPKTHYLPQHHNTYLAFAHTAPQAHPFHRDLAVFVRFRGAPALQLPADNTINLCALDKDTTATPSQVTDLRWRFRYEAWRDAKIWRQEWDAWGHSEAQKFVPLLLTVIRTSGFWSVWFDVFADIRLVRQMLVQDIPGTAVDCFDTDFNPVWK